MTTRITYLEGTKAEVPHSHVALQVQDAFSFSSRLLYTYMIMTFRHRATLSLPFVFSFDIYVCLASVQFRALQRK
jgi:hypothetical protein